MNTNKFTQEIKDKWLAGLKSGKYKQGFGQLRNQIDNTHCCLGVLEEECLKETNTDAYGFIDETINPDVENKIWKTNDADRDNPDYPKDYSNVIPLIEQLPVQELSEADYWDDDDFQLGD